jgi:hypothetical protein
VHKIRPEAVITLHGIQHTDPDTLPGLDSQTGRLVNDEDFVVAVQEGNHGAKAYASVPLNTRPVSEGLLQTTDTPKAEFALTLSVH